MFRSFLSLPALAGLAVMAPLLMSMTAAGGAKLAPVPVFFRMTHKVTGTKPPNFQSTTTVVTYRNGVERDAVVRNVRLGTRPDGSAILGWTAEFPAALPNTSITVDFFTTVHTYDNAPTTMTRIFYMDVR